MKRAAGLLILSVLVLGIFGFTTGHAEPQCAAWGWEDSPAPDSEQVYQQYEDVTTELPMEVRDLLAKAITGCTNDEQKVGIGVCVPPDPETDCVDPTD